MTKNNRPLVHPKSPRATFLLTKIPHLRDPREGAVFFSKEFLRQNLGQGNLKGIFRWEVSWGNLPPPLKKTYPTQKEWDL